MYTFDKHPCGLSDAVMNKIYVAWCDDNISKSDLARRHGVSTRSIGRVLDIVKSKIDSDESLDQVAESVSTPAVDDFKIVASTRCITVINKSPEVKISESVVSIDSDNPRFDTVMSMVRSSDFSNDSIREIYEAISYRAHVEKVTSGALTVDPEHGIAVYAEGTNNEIQLSGKLASALVTAVIDNDDFDLARLRNFAKLLVNNGNHEIVEELYDFLLASDITVDTDGMVHCWKKVGLDYKDLYSGKFDNSPGQVCEVPRMKVDSDRSRTCSYGLHVCSAAYLPHYGSDRCKIVEVVVNPADFISIPDEYYHNDNGTVTAKARVCRYQVLRDVTDKFIK